MNPFRKPAEPAIKPPHIFEACREVATLLNMAVKVMGRAKFAPNDMDALALWLDLHRAQAMAERIGHGKYTA
jgi:hypothetical protein